MRRTSPIGAKSAKRGIPRAKGFPLGGEPHVMRITTVWCARAAN